jgi:hypothetical protein
MDDSEKEISEGEGKFMRDSPDSFRFRFGSGGGEKTPRTRNHDFRARFQGRRWIGESQTEPVSPPLML